MKRDIQLLKFTRESYPSSNDIESNAKNLDFLPLSLQVLLKNIFPKNCSDVIISSIGQSLIQHSRPRTIFTPLQVCLAVQMHRQFGPRFLTDSLHRQVFCV